MEKVTGIAIVWGLAAALAIVTTSSSFAASPQPTTKLSRIVIDDGWDGYSPVTPVRARWVIEPRGSGFVLSGTRSQGRMPAPSDDASQPQERETTNVPAAVVPTPAVDALLRAMRAAPQPTIDLALFGSAVSHAGEVIDPQVRALAALTRSQPSRQRIVDWGNSVRHGQPLAEAITAGVDNASHSDDYPYARVEASFTDGSSLVFSTDSQSVLMLPWHDASGRKTFSADLSHAVAAVLSSSSVNRDRMSGVPSENDFDEALQAGMMDSFNRFKLQIVAPKIYASLQSRFVIRSIDTLSAAIGTFEMNPSPLLLSVELPAGPSNLVLDAMLDTHGSTLAKPDELDGIANELNTAVTATGLRQAMLANPSDLFIIQHGMGGGAFDDGSKKQFIDRMSEAHKLPELGNHPEVLDGAVLVAQGDNALVKGPRSKDPVYWIALRDRRAVALTSLSVGGNAGGHPVRIYDADGKAL